MAASSLSIKSTDTSNKVCQKSVTNINPNASAENLATFGQMVNALSDHTYIESNLIDKTNVDTEERPGGSDKTEPSLSVASNGAVTYNGDGTLYVTNGDVNNIFLNIYNNVITAKNAAGNTPTSFTGTIYASEGTNYAAKSAEFSCANS